MADLKKVDKKKNPGLAKLPKGVRNKMGFMKRGGKVKKKRAKAMGGGMMKKRAKATGGGMMKKRAKAMGGGRMKKRMKRGGKAK